MTDFTTLEDSEIADIILDDETTNIDLDNVEEYTRIFGGVSSNAELNRMYDQHMQEVCPDVTIDNENEYNGQ